MSETAVEDDDHRSATERVTEDILEQLQLSGERDRLKQMMLDDLHTHGWTANLFREASHIASAHHAKVEAASSSGKTPAPLTVDRLAERLSKNGHDTIPDEVRTRVLRRLLYIVRQHFKEEGYLPVDPPDG